MNKHEKDHLTELKEIDESSVEELAEFYPVLSRNAKKRILEKCLEKTDESEFQNGITVTGTEIYKRPVWSRVAGIAAAFAGVGVIITGAVMLDRNNKISSSCHSSSGTEQISVISTSERTKATTSVSSTTKAATTTTQAMNIIVETSEYVVYTTSSFTTTSITTTETTETSETTTTDVTTTNDGENHETTETIADITANELIGSWNADGRVGSRVFEFHADGSSGKYILNETGTGLAFVYEIRDELISFRFGAADAEIESGTISRISDDTFVIHWYDGSVESFSRID